MPNTDPLDEFIQSIFREMSRGDRVVEVPPALGPEIEFVWTKRERPPFDHGERWVRWQRTQPGDRWWNAFDGRGFTHTWGSLNVHYRQIVIEDPTAS